MQLVFTYMHFAHHFKDIADVLSASVCAFIVLIVHQLNIKLFPLGLKAQNLAKSLFIGKRHVGYGAIKIIKKIVTEPQPTQWYIW